MNYTALARAHVNIELFEDDTRYEALVVSTNGNMLQPYDTSTTLIGTVLRNNIDITSTIPNVRWTKWNPSADNLEECTDWNKLHIGQSSILITKDDIDSKSVFTFEAYDKYDKLLCSNSISLIDVNDLLASTNKPMNPYIGQLWIDDSIEPVNIYAWNGYKWVVSGAIGVVVNNLLYNTGFTYNMDKWEIVGESSLMYTPTPHTYLERRFLKLNSETITDITRGITQTTVEEVVQNSDYSFQMLFYSNADTMFYSNNIFVNIYTVDTQGKETLLEEKVVPAEKLIQKLFFTFKSNYNTEKFRVEILGEDNKRFNFNIAEIAIYNTSNRYPWTPNAKDATTVLTQENVWNALSNNGTVQGITSIKNEYTGQLEYYINASMINAGKVAAQYLDVYNLSVTRKDNPEIKTLEITDDGKIHIRVSELKIEIGEDEEPAKIQDYVGTEIGSVSNVINNRIDGTENILNNKIDGTESTLNNKINSTESVLTGKIDDTESALNNKIDNTESTLNNKIDSTGEALQNEIDATNTAINETKTEINLSLDAIEQRVSNEEKQTESLIELTNKGVYISAYDNGQQSFVDVGGEEVYIKSNSIKLEGYTTINGGFTVDEEGNMEANNGKFSGTIVASVIRSDDTDDPVFSLTADGTLVAKRAIISGEVGGIVPTTETISSSNNKFIVHGESGLMYCEDATVFDSIISECDIREGTININNKFIVDSEGRLTARGFKGDMDEPEINGGTVSKVEITESEFIGGTIDGSTIEDATIKNTSGTLLIDSNGTIKSGSITSSGSISSTTVYASGSITGGSFYTSGSVSASSISTTGNITSSGSISASSLSSTGSIDTSNNITHSNNIIYKGTSNTFIADHYAIGSETNTIGEMSFNTLKLGQGAIAYGTTTVSNITADAVSTVQVSFSTSFSAAPHVSVTLQSEDPNVNSSVSSVTSTGFSLNCRSSTATSATFYWMAVGAS